MNIEVRKRAFNLVAPIIFNADIIDDYLSVICHIKNKEYIDYFLDYLTKKEYQEKILFEEGIALKHPYEDFAAICVKQLDYCIANEMQDITITSYLLLIKKALSTRLDQSVDWTEEATFFDYLQQLEYGPKTQYLFRNLFAIIAIHGQFMSQTEKIENLIEKFEKKL